MFVLSYRLARSGAVLSCAEPYNTTKYHQKQTRRAGAVYRLAKSPLLKRILWRLLINDNADIICKAAINGTSRTRPHTRHPS
ncbi:hypothetical protein THS27_17505 [Thalassospira sp. MCCC 1A01428]|nr:hypothetical protein THS27_17505 [Thalassospira sp. MCCC 1A01428]